MKRHQGKSPGAFSIKVALILKVDTASTFKINGGRGPNLVEPQALTVSVGRKVVWRKDKVDFTELAKLRWVDKWTVERLMSHFGKSEAGIKKALRLLKKRGV